MQAFEAIPFPLGEAGERLGPRPLESVLHRGAVATIGAFCAFPSQRGFEDSGPIERHIFAVPRTSVRIQHEGGPGFLSDANNVCFYNRGQVYRRERVSEEGDRCDWFAVEPSLLREAIRVHDPASADADRPLAFSRGRCDGRTYALQRLIVRHLLEAQPIDDLFVGEAVLAVLVRLLENVYGDTGACASSGERAKHRDLVDAAKRVLAATFATPATLEQLTSRLGVSTFHLCRVFRRVTGQTLHDYRSQLRLRASLESVAEAGTDLTRVALDLGYSSHSHFTAAFGESFATTPSEWRRRAHRSAAVELASRLETQQRR